MMATILTLIVLGMIFQGLMLVVDTVLDAVKVNDVLKSIPIVGSLLQPIWAYLFVAISGLSGSMDLGIGSTQEVLRLGTFGSDVALALVILAFIPVREAGIKALRRGIGRS